MGERIMSKDLACVAFLSIMGVAGSLGIVVAAGIEVQPDVISIEALGVSEPVMAKIFLKRASGARHIKNDEALLTGRSGLLAGVSR